MFVMSETPISNTAQPKLTWFVNPIQQPNGLVTLEFIDGSGRVISVDQMGSIAPAPAGSAGAGQLCMISGNLATFFPAPQFSGPGALCQSFVIVAVPQ